MKLKNKCPFCTHWNTVHGCVCADECNNFDQYYRKKKTNYSRMYYIKTIRKSKPTTKKQIIKMANGSAFVLFDDPNTRSLSPIPEQPKSDVSDLAKEKIGMLSEIFAHPYKIKPDFLSDLKAAFPTPDDFYREVMNLPDYTKAHEMIYTQAANANKTRADQIREKLKENGYSFETESDGELFIFLSTKCRIEYYEKTKLMVLYADEKLICQWYDTFDIQTDFDPQNPTTIKSTITYGKPPIDNL